MKGRVTQLDIARAAGVHNTTVSLALRNYPGIPEATRKRIQAIAEQLGYHPDPALQALVAYRNGRMPARRQETIAYVTHWTSRWGWKDVPAQAELHAGALRQAEERGFQLEHFWFGEPGMTPRRFGDMLFHRGIAGVILASQASDSDAYRDVDWSRLTAVKIGSLPQTLVAHRIMTDQASALRLVMRKAHAAGYERVGLAVPYGWDDLADRAWSAAFVAEQYRLPEDGRVPILFWGDPCRPMIAMAGRECAVSQEALARWFDHYQPDAIVSHGPFVRDTLRRLGLCIPRDVAYVDLCLQEAETGTAGVRESGERVGQLAVEQLIALRHQNLLGLPPVATTTLVEGAWHDGCTLPRRTTSAWVARCSAAELFSARRLVGAA